MFGEPTGIDQKRMAIVYAKDFARIAEAAGVELPPATMMRECTISRQAEILRRKPQFNTSAKLVPFRRGGTRRSAILRGF
jgi:hypothetical protein